MQKSDILSAASRMPPAENIIERPNGALVRPDQCRRSGRSMM
jgi:hypothetical protein